MEIWNQFIATLSNDNIINFLISVGAGATWDFVKNHVKQNKMESSLEYLELQVFADTFREFYGSPFFNLEFDEDIVMNSFLEQVKEIKTLEIKDVTKYTLGNTTGLDIGSLELSVWKDCFKRVCSRDEYEPVFRKIVLGQFIDSKIDRDFSWMKEYMNDNCCNLCFPMIEDSMPMLEKVDTTLNTHTWKDLKSLLWELLINAQTHGSASNCRILIDNKSITIVDNGIPFNPLTLLNGDILGGGCISIRQWMEKYSDTQMLYEYEKNCNMFKVIFEFNAFDVNQLCEIIVPSLMFRCTPEYLYPEGEFKYYFIDIAQTLTHSENYGASYSSIISLLGSVRHRKFGNDPCKVFVYFSNCLQEDTKYVYERFLAVKKSYKHKYDNIVLIKD